MFIFLFPSLFPFHVLFLCVSSKIYNSTVGLTSSDTHSFKTLTSYLVLFHVRLFKDSKLFICVQVQTSVQKQLESRQETMENVYAEVEKRNLVKKKVHLV